MSAEPIPDAAEITALATARDMVPFEVILDVFGGLRTIARALNIEASTVMRWGQRPHGQIPYEYLRPLLEAAAARRRRLTLAELVWGRPGISRRIIHTLDSVPQPPVDALGAMARALTRQSPDTP